MKIYNEIKNWRIIRKIPGLKKYITRYMQYSFEGTNCQSYEQYEACITRLYHTIEKGLSYPKYRAGFGKDNINALIKTMENYITDGYDAEAFFYRTALSTLYAYVNKNSEYGYTEEKLNERINELRGTPNSSGGTIIIRPIEREQQRLMNFKDLMEKRHSIRQFSGDEVNTEWILEALKIAQYTPSACNRQGWKTRIIRKRNTIKDVLLNQNGNKGFGEGFDKLLILTADLRYFNRERELFQAYIDGGMYAESVLNALFYLGIGAVPLSAALTEIQEENIRSILKIDQAEVFILFIGVGNYPDECLATKSERRKPKYEII